MNAQVKKALEQLKRETAAEMGIELGADQTARNNGAVGGNMVRKLVEFAESQIAKQ